MFVNLLSLSIFLTLSFYFLIGVLKKDLWITIPRPGFGGVFPAERKRGWRAVVFGLFLIFLVSFGWFSFSYGYDIHYKKPEIVLSVLIAALLTIFIKYSEKKLPATNPFKTVIPALVIIIVVVYLILLYIFFQGRL